MIVIKKSEDWITAKAINDLCMSPDDWDVKPATQLWIVWDGDMPLAYATIIPFMEDGVPMAFMGGCAVLPIARGKGLQKRLIRARVAWAKKLGVVNIITYTIRENVQSNNSLIRCGFKQFLPHYPWTVGNQAIYWEKPLA